LLWDRQARQLIAKPAYDLDYLGIFTDWHTRHSPESVVLGLPESLRAALRCRGERDVMTRARAVTEPVIESTRGASPARIGSPGSAAAAPRMRTRGFASVGSLKLW
jgi:hypothetical protein